MLRVLQLMTPSVMLLLFFPVLALLFQSGLLLVFTLWRPLPAVDGAAFVAVAFVWGLTDALWDFSTISEKM